MENFPLPLEYTPYLNLYALKVFNIKEEVDFTLTRYLLTISLSTSDRSLFLIFLIGSLFQEQIFSIPEFLSHNIIS